MTRIFLCGALAVLSLACQRSATRPDSSLIATGPVVSDTAAGQERRPVTVEQPYRVPADVLRNPEERMSLMQQLRRAIVANTRNASDDEYRAVVRPRVARELMTAGFAAADVQYVLADVDYARSLR